jgi:DNA-binding NarL/FixJ family response regulator
MSDSIEREIRVVIVDDHPIMRGGTQGLLEQAPDIKLLGVAGDGEQALRMARGLRPDVLLLDLALPDKSGIVVARELRTSCPEVAVVIFSAYDDAAHVRGAIEAGARGYLPKTVSGADVLHAVRKVAAGEACFPAGYLPGPGDPGALTPRERFVLQQMAEGKRNTEIAEALVVSLRTVEFHVTRLMQKLGVSSRAEALVLAREFGLVSSTERKEPDASLARMARLD